MKSNFKRNFITLGLFCFLFIPQFCLSQTHVTLNVQNCVASSDSTLEFDIYIVNDGAASLLFGAISMGINYDSAILNGGNPSLNAFTYQLESRDKIFAKTARYTTQHVLPRSHLRLTMSPTTKISAPMLAPKVQYKIGRFTFTNTKKWAVKSKPSFNLQLQNRGGYTTCAVNVFVNDAPSSDTLDKEENRKGIVDCQVVFK